MPPNRRSGNFSAVASSCLLALGHDVLLSLFLFVSKPLMYRCLCLPQDSMQSAAPADAVQKTVPFKTAQASLDTSVVICVFKKVLN